MPPPMNDKELRDIIREEMEANRPATLNLQDVVRTAVQETLISIGVDSSDPLKVQQDLAFLRDLRQAHATVKSKGILILVGLFLSSVTAAMWIGIKSALQH